ncbi:cell divisionFtsK/SpoIIIE [Chthoniobacter flavus Ellin428]|uniref:Cell divisionFtsK/SpoIIIE n=1 Tax=Chthoniobacter flavus Ellin428 TaxID=497964 RepID=B4CZR6_9BACT|nr:DNA translocase FtsK [Chthoniobacter flavus]EDY20230.1 cell divisionFtsK/SpoIIIE [Chthoniobacter flavus Ellin428]TCO94127.1 DNA translocase FtsK [Chthoniobacter flavus]
MARTQEAPSSHPLHEVLSLVFLGIGTLLYLALISYSPSDVPSWFPLSSQAAARGAVLNFVGRTGAIVACSSYAFLGAASYLLAALLLGYGGAKLLNPELRLTSRAWWSVGFILSGACLAHLLPWSLLDMERLNIAGPGGWVGKWLGGMLLKNMLGTVGSTIVLLVIYASSLIFLTGLHPIAAARQIANWPSVYLEKRRARKMAEADEKERLALEAERLDRQRKKLEKTLTKKGVAPIETEPGEPIAPAVAELFSEPEPTRPEPQIIDSTLPPPPRRKEKKDKFQPLTSVSCENYELPSFDLLDPVDMGDRQTADPTELLAIQDTVIDTLGQFGISVSRGDITRGPTITRYEVYPAKGVRVDKIVSLERDIARATRAERINILAPIPGKDTVGIEIANSKKQKVTLRELLESEDFQNAKAKIPIALGKDVYGKTIIGDLAAMPHGLVAGTTGSGKSVCINSIIASILYRFSPEDLRFIMIDPKVVEMQIYNTLPHLVVPVVTDPKKVLLALRWAIDEMEKRYAIFAKTGVRNIGSFNSRPMPKSQAELDAAAAAKAVAPELPLDAAPTEPVDPESLSSEERIEKMTTIKVQRDNELIIPDRMPYIVIIVDELADLMQTAPADVESAIARITQKARAAGIHMIIATQTPRADVITGVIKANVPCRVAFQVASALDSRVILDENGAERLLGQGDMMYRPPGTSRLIRAQGVLVTDEEIRQVVEHASGQSEPAFENSIHERLQNSGSGDEDEEVSDEDEELVDKCIEVMRQEKKASTSLFQRRLRLGYTRAARILDILEQRGYVGAGEGAKPREILVDLDAFD